MNTSTKKTHKNSRYKAYEKYLKRLSTASRKELEEIKVPKEAAIAQSFNSLVNIQGRQHYYDLMMHLYQENSKKLLNNSAYLRALARMCYFYEDFVNEIHTWRRPSKYVEKQFPSLLRHLFAKYEMPLFFDSVWLSNSFKHQQWYVMVAQGQNIRKCYGFPFEMSKKMSYYFMTAPARFDVYKALKWARLMVCANGDAHLTEQIISCNFSGYARFPIAFWEKTICFFAHNERISTHKLREVFDFLVSIRRSDPRFTFKGRTVVSLVRLADEWHQDIERSLNEKNNNPAVTWEKSHIEDYSFLMSQKNKTIKLEVVELMNSIELREEGSKMKHCVGTYYGVCERRSSAIFSIREGTYSHATIQVNLKNRMVIQAKAACNKPISGIAKKVMRKWAHKNELEIGEVL